MDKKIKFYVEKTSFWPQAAAVLLGLASVFQLVGCWGRWNDRMFLLTNMVLPVAAFLLYAVFLITLGRSALWLTSLPLLAGVAFYALQVWYDDDLLLRMIGLAVCVVAAVLYVGTVVSLIRTKWLLVLLFAGPFLYRAFYRDVLALQNGGEAVLFLDGIREVSFLFVLLAMTFASLGMRKLVKEKKAKSKEPTEKPDEPAPVPAPAPAPALDPEIAAVIDTPHEPDLVLTGTATESEQE